jgi:tetratricopeptide (TPR) repeat protein
MGVVSAETWTNLGLCCFYAGQYDFTFSCFERALVMAADAALPDIWYNIGQVGDAGKSACCFFCMLGTAAAAASTSCSPLH